MNKYALFFVAFLFTGAILAQPVGFMIDVDSVMKRTENFKLGGLNGESATWSMIQFSIGVPTKFKSSPYSAESNYTLFRLVSETKKDLSDNFALIYGNSYEYMSCPLPTAINESNFLNDRTWDSKSYRTNKFGVTLGARQSFMRRGANQHFSIDFLQTFEFNIAQTVIGKQRTESEKFSWTQKKLEGRRVVELWPSLRLMYNIYGFGVKYQVLSQFKNGPYAKENFGHWRVFFCMTIPTS